MKQEAEKLYIQKINYSKHSKHVRFAQKLTKKNKGKNKEDAQLWAYNTNDECIFLKN